MDAFQFKSYLEQMIQNAVLVTEFSMELKKRNEIGEKYCSYIRSIAWRAGLAINAMQKCTVSYFFYAHKLALTAKSILQNIPDSEPDKHILKNEIENLLNVLETELKDTSNTTAMKLINEDLDLCPKANISERIKMIEEKQKYIPTLFRTPSGTQPFKHDIDEHYPRFPSRENIINLDKVMSLPTVPEDSFTTCIKRTASSSSLSKSLRKLKYHLQQISGTEYDIIDNDLSDKMFFSNLNDHIHDIIIEDSEEDHFFKLSEKKIKENTELNIGKNILRNNEANSDESIKEYMEKVAEKNIHSTEENIEKDIEGIVYALIDDCIGKDMGENITHNDNKYIYFKK